MVKRVGKTRTFGISAPIDAAVMATASLRAGMVVTRDVDDFAELASHFKGVRVLGATRAGA
jgi:hypothetical protein